MFEHLDDPSPPSADGATRRRVASRRASLDRRRRVVVGSAAAAVSALALVGVAVGVSNSGKPAVNVTSHLPTTVVTVPTTVATPVTTAVPTTAVPTTTVPLPALACAPLTPTPTSDGTNPNTGTRRTATTTLGSVSATLTGIAGTAYSSPTLNGATLTVLNGGRTLLAGPVEPPKSSFGGAPVVIPWAISGVVGGANPTVAGPPEDPFSSPPLCLARFAPNDMPTVLLGLNLGGAHCCTIVRAIALSPTSAGPPVDDDLGNPTATIQNRGGQASIVTADNNFAYAFTDFADSAMPVMILSFASGAFVDTTRSYPDLIAADAAGWWKAFNDNASNGLGLLAGWVADQCLLGKSAGAWAQVSQLLAQGRLNSNPNGPTGASYVQQLHALLAKYHYC